MFSFIPTSSLKSNPNSRLTPVVNATLLYDSISFPVTVISFPSSGKVYYFGEITVLVLKLKTKLITVPRVTRLCFYYPNIRNCIV